MRMGRVLGAAALVGAGVLAYRAMQKRKQEQELQGETDRGLAMQPVRDAGPENMRNQESQWSRADEHSDESFPASDPPATY